MLDCCSFIHPRAGERVDYICRSRSYAAAKSCSIVVRQHFRFGSPIVCGGITSEKKFLDVYVATVGDGVRKGCFEPAGFPVFDLTNLLTCEIGDGWASTDFFVVIFPNFR